MDGKQGVLGGERDEEHVIVEGLVFKVKLLLQMCVCVCVCVRKAHRPPSVLCAFRGAACHFKLSNKRGCVVYLNWGCSSNFLT